MTFKMPEPASKEFFFCNKCGANGYGPGGLHMRRDGIQCSYAAVSQGPYFTADQVRAAYEQGRGEVMSVIGAHNADCIAQCEARKAAGSTQCPMKGYRRNCSDCPRDGMVDLAAVESTKGAAPLPPEGEGERK